MKPSTVNWLVEHGFDPTAANHPGANQTLPLHYASLHGNAEVVADLLQAGADIARLNGDENNALWSACYAESEAVAELLIAHGIDIDHQNDSGATALIYASSAGKSNMVRLLLASGADVSCVTQDEFSALDLAANIETLRMLRNAIRTSAKEAVL